MGLIQASRGTRDILPDEVIYWQRVEEKARDLLHQAGYRELRTPIFEQTTLFERGIGEATDVVGKEMYTFSDRGDRSITLRPEGTAGAVRAYIEHKLHAQGGVQRLWYTGPMFRYERPQAGRQRQFHQIGVELLGSLDPRADAEVIAIAATLLNRLGIDNWTLSLNSLGTAADRQRYREALVSYLSDHQQDLDPDSQARLQRNPLRILDSKDPQTQVIAQAAPSILDYLAEESRQHFERVQQLLQSLGIPYQLNPCLVRGLDYYTHTAFEFLLPDLGSQATVCGGGRYDGLVAELGGPDTSAVGWAIGLERLILILQRGKLTCTSALDFYCVSRGVEAEAQALQLCHALRTCGLSVEMDLSGSAFPKQLKRADRSGALACLILGETEGRDRSLQLKWLHSGEQQSLGQQEFIQNIDQVKAQLGAARSLAS
ncbi:MAG: histidine--tRNA ligase [Acaryochloridaceae cyanobacterium SU_2_1]|nr:histidine--tRNA ligase [Acaryochloridaceae cyanobacterium SU_2_1]